MRISVTALASALAVGALAGGCQNEVWLSAPDAHRDLDAGRDAGAPTLDANDAGAGEIDAAAEDAALPRRACELTPVTVATTLGTAASEAPTLATSGRLATLRYGVLVPPAASVTPTDQTRLYVLDAEGALRAERTFRVDDATGSASSLVTLHSLFAGTGDEGFLLLGPSAIQRLDADGAALGSPVSLALAPSARWQRAAGWIDADRFAFVSDTPELRIVVFDRASGSVTPTSISAASAAVVHIDDGGVTIAGIAPSNDIVVYDPDLSGTETLRVAWNDGTPIGDRLLGVGLVGAERTWLVHSPCEFRSIVTSFRVAPDGTSSAGAMTQLLCPLVATREGPFVAIASENRLLALYDLEARSFSMLAMTFDEPPILEHERDGAHVAVLARVPTAAGAVALDLSCGR